VGFVQDLQGLPSDGLLDIVVPTAPDPRQT
jgi:hypothetical protein